MDKNEILQQIQTLSAQHLITPDELIAAYNQGTTGAPVKNTHATQTPPRTDHALTKNITISDILYYIGGAIVFIGIAVMIGGSWDALNPFTRVLVTLGSAIAAYTVGVLLGQNKDYDGVSQAFYLISALVMPMGLYVVLNSAGIDVYTSEVHTVISLILFTMYGVSALIFRKAIFTVFSVIFGTWFFFALTNSLVGNNPSIGENFYLYRVLVTGISYMLLGYHFAQNNEKEPLSHWLYGVGSLFFLGSALALGGWSPNQNIFWELIYPGLVFGIIFLSVYVKSRAFLTWGSTFLMAYILKITSEYFSAGLGWPLSLVLAGFMLIGVGYYSVYINKKYIAAA